MQSYAVTKENFDLQVACFPFQGNNCPPLQLVSAFCETAYSWLKAGLENVIVVHCKGGMARTGLMISCLLLHLKVCSSHATFFWVGISILSPMQCYMIVLWFVLWHWCFSVSSWSMLCAYQVSVWFCCSPIRRFSLTVLGQGFALLSKKHNVFLKIKCVGLDFVWQFFPTAEEAVNHYNQKRCVDSNGLVLPSHLVSLRSLCFGQFAFCELGISQVMYKQCRYNVETINFNDFYSDHLTG